MTISKNVNRYRTYVTKSSLRQFISEGSDTIEAQKIKTKETVLSQWKLVKHAKTYLSKYYNNYNQSAIENAFNKEFAHFLQKIQPSIYGTELSLTESKSQDSKKDEDKGEQNPHALLPDVFNGLKNFIKVSDGIKSDIPKWKTGQMTATASKESVISRTHQIVASIKSASSSKEQLAQINELIVHINSYPETKHLAVKEGTISSLLKIKSRTTNNELTASLNEAFALLGYAHPVLGNGIRILSIDGGGVRGILVIEMLKKIEEFTGKRIYEMFDLICGVSTGAIIASLVAVKRYSLEEIAEIYKKLSTQIFTQSALRGTSSLVWSHSYYNTALWEKLLKEQIGEQTLISTSRNSCCPKLCALSAIVSQSRVSAYIFRNYTFPCQVQSQYVGGHNHLIWQAVRASAAAPTYFQEFKLGNMLHQDGGILFNNPTAVAVHEAKLLWPQTPIECVISFGTGRTVPFPIDVGTETATANNSSWKSKFYAIIESATDTQRVHTLLSDLLPANIYYRFNPYLTEMLDIAEIDSNKLKQLELDAIMYLRRNEDKFQEAAMILKSEKTYIQKMKDWLNTQKEISGL